jgi:hypothetical protein
VLSGRAERVGAARWLKVIDVFNERKERRQLKLFPSDVELPETEADVARLRVS